MELPKIYDPYAYHRPNCVRWKGSVIPAVLPSALFITLVAVVVTILYEKTDIKLSTDTTFIPILGFVVGLLLTYRTNTAYDRYWEGRRLWSAMVVAIRNLTRTFWIGLKEKGTKDVLEKKTAINLLLGFAVATKHYLREELGSQHEDLNYLLSNIRTTLPGFEPIEDQDSTEKKQGKSFIKLFKPKVRRKKFQNHNLPLEISLYLSSYINRQEVSVPTGNSMHLALNTMVDCLTQLERILSTPIPLAYSIHLSQAVWIFCLGLPFQLVRSFNYFTIPIVFLSSYILIGIEQIGTEIENPFGYDDNDLDLNEYCRWIKLELVNITANPPPAKDWIYSPENCPFGDSVTALEASKLSVDEIRSKFTVTASASNKDKSLSLDISVQH